MISGTRLLASLTIFLTIILCAHACELQWRTARVGHPFNLDRTWAVMPIFGHAVARWKSQVPGRVQNENLTSVAYFCEAGDEQQPSTFEVLHDVSIDDGGCRLEWVRLYDMDTFQLQPLFLTSNVQDLSSFCLVNATLHNDALLFAKCDVFNSIAIYCINHQQFEVTPLPNTTVVLTVRAVKRREVLISSTAEITNNMVNRRPDSVVTRVFRNFGVTEAGFRVDSGYELIMDSSYSEDYGWRLNVAVDYNANLLTTAVNQWHTTLQGEGHGTYITTRRNSTRTFVSFSDNFVAEPRSKSTAVVTVIREELQVPYEAEEVFYDAADRIIGKANVRGVWRGVNTFRGQTDFYQVPLESNGNDTKQVH